jgi:serine protease DegS
MNRSLRLLLGLALAGLVGCVSAYAILNLHAPAKGPAATPTIALVATAGEPISNVPNRMSTSSSAREQPGVLVSYRDAVARAAPSVVTVHSARASQGPLRIAPKTLVKGVGSGVIIDRDGHIVTNYHVVEGASGLAVALADGTVHLVRVVGVDPESDIALLKIDVDGVQPIAVADINDVAVGDVVLAVGNPLGIGQTVTQGIVSAVARKGIDPIENFVQTDAAINPGNSGGALIDTAGRLVGINAVILSHSGGSEGIGFAIPVDYVHAVAEALKAKGRVARAWLGLSTAAPARGHGALVVTVDDEGPADRAGIEPGDVIVRMGERNVEHPQQLRGVVIGVEPGTRVPIEFVRNAKRVTRDVEVVPVPTRQAAR